MAIVATPSDPVRATDSDATTRWQQAMKTAIRDSAELCRVLGLPPELEPAAKAAAKAFPVFAPREFVAKMKLGDQHDPLLRQVLPIADETEEVLGFTTDPVGDGPASPSPGLIKKYHGRALLITTGACAVHCRYCFRRHFPYDSTPHSTADWQPSIDRIAADATIEEILLSGGDPLTIVDHQLADLACRLAAIPHLRRLRIHTRLPIMIPDRVTNELVRWLRGTRLIPVLVIHANHPAELDERVGNALGRIVDAGIPVLNQAVLLRGVNDNADVLAELCRQLSDLRVMPYYLHQFDRVAGAAHFEVPIEEGRMLIQKIRSQLPGYAVPRYVQEIAGESSKRILA